MHAVKTLSHIQIFIVAGFIAVTINACSPTKKIPEGKRLLVKNKILINKNSLEKSDIEPYIRPKTNYKLLGLVRFHLWLYNQVNEAKLQKRKKAYTLRIQKRNIRRSSRGKKIKSNKRELFGERLLNVGEEPVIYDKFIAKKSTTQVQLFLQRKGYFKAEVTDSIKPKGKKKTISIYTINTGSPHIFDRVKYTIPDSAIRNFVLQDKENSLIKPGENFDMDLLESERERITFHLNNLGYYRFTKEHIYFSVDTNEIEKRAKINIGIKNNSSAEGNQAKSTLEKPHERFVIDSIYIFPEYSFNNKVKVHFDSLHTEGFSIIHHKKIKFKNKVLAQSIFIKRNQQYNFLNVQNTYKRLAELKAFKYINIRFTEKENNKLNCYIELSAVAKQALTLETEGTNSSGNLGLSGSIIYQNRNLNKGAELLELRLKGGIAAQRALNDDNTNTNTPEFNTIEVGPSISLYVPRFLVPFKLKTSLNSNPKTIFTGGLNYQKRPDYTRTITNFSLGYTWNETSKKIHTIKPFVVDFVNVNLSDEFLDLLSKNVLNRFIVNSFQSHLTTSSRYSFTYNGQDLSKKNDFSFFQANLESSGNALRSLSQLTNNLKPGTIKQNPDGQYSIFDIVYAQYLKADVDYRYYHKTNNYGNLVFRLAGGAAKPFKNFSTLPFEKSFFSGGSNGIRAWQSRTIGPGSYSNNQFSYDQFGDYQIEANIEHRFKIFKLLNGALFIDAGNVWLERSDDSRPGGTFKLNSFYEELAIGTGIGMRLDFSFFIIRLDMGIKVRDPQFIGNNRWIIDEVFDKKWRQDYLNDTGYKYNFTTFNLGVGYPF